MRTWWMVAPERRTQRTASGDRITWQVFNRYKPNQRYWVTTYRDGPHPCLDIRWHCSCDERPPFDQDGEPRSCIHMQTIANIGGNSCT